MSFRACCTGTQPRCAWLTGLPESSIAEARSVLFGDQPPQAVEARRRYGWAGQVHGRSTAQRTHTDPLPGPYTGMDQPPLAGHGAVFLTLVLVFQAVFSWATPLMDLIDGASSALAGWVTTTLGESALSSFIADGVIAGVGSVVIFLPQILILFLFIILLEDTGYLARAAFLMDRAMRKVGLSGQSVIPMLSSFACAVPSIMATRVIPDRRDRFATILAAPFMTCSARLPIYALLIAAFVPASSVGWFNLQGLVLFGLYLLGIIGGLFTAWLMKRSALRGPKPQFALALPEFRRPNLQTVLIKLMDRAQNIPQARRHGDFTRWRSWSGRWRIFHAWTPGSFTPDPGSSLSAGKPADRRTDGAKLPGPRRAAPWSRCSSHWAGTGRFPPR